MQFVLRLIGAILFLSALLDVFFFEQFQSELADRTLADAVITIGLLAYGFVLCVPPAFLLRHPGIYLLALVLIGCYLYTGLTRNLSVRTIGFISVMAVPAILLHMQLRTQGASTRSQTRATR